MPAVPLHIIHSHFIPASLLILLPGIALSSHPGHSLIHPLAVAEKDKREEEGTITRNTTAGLRARKEQSPFRVWADSSRRPSRNLRCNTTTCVSEDDRLTGQVSRKTNAEGGKEDKTRRRWG